MKLAGEIQYDGEKRGLLGTTYHTNISFSLQDVSEEDLRKLCETVEQEVYTFGLGNHIVREKGGRGSRVNEHLFSSLRGKNTVRLDHYKSRERANIFIHGPKAEEIDMSLRGLIPAESLENLALKERE